MLGRLGLQHQLHLLHHHVGLFIERPAASSSTGVNWSEQRRRWFFPVIPRICRGDYGPNNTFLSLQRRLLSLTASRELLRIVDVSYRIAGNTLLLAPP